jgi:hypothetical protein
MPAIESNELPELAVHSHGIGQESSAIHEMWSDRNFRQRYGGKTIIIVTSDTGDEKPETTQYRIEVLEPRLRELGLPYHFISTSAGFHTGAWANGGLIHQFKTNGTFGAVSFAPSCSSSLKIAPIYKFLEYYVEQHYGFAAGDKRGLKAFAKKFGKIRMVIGFAKGEESRLATPPPQLDFGPVILEAEKKAKPRDLWMSEAIDKMFPLMDLGMDRAAAQQFIRGAGQPVPPPSCCVRCPYASHEEIVWIARHYPAMWEEWKEIEAVGLANPRHERRDDSGNILPRHGVKGLRNAGTRKAPQYVPRTLEDFYQEGLRKVAHIPIELLDAYLEERAFSHGHNVPSKY